MNFKKIINIRGRVDETAEVQIETLMRSDETAEVWASGSSRLQGFELSDFETPVEYPPISKQENVSQKANRSNRPQRFIKGPIGYEWIA